MHMKTKSLCVASDEIMLQKCFCKNAVTMQLHHGNGCLQLMSTRSHPSTLTSSFFFLFCPSHQPRCQSSRDLFSRQNVLWVAEMRLILIREPIITLPLLLSLMLTTASPPLCLSFTMTISLCLHAWSLSHCPSGCVSPYLPVFLCLSVCLSAGLYWVSCLKACLPVSHHIIIIIISGVFTCLCACPCDRLVHGRFCQNGQIGK